MPPSANKPTRSPRSTSPNSTACTVSVLAKVFPTAKFLNEKRCSSSSVAPICATAPISPQARNAPFGDGTLPDSAGTSTAAQGAAKRNRA